MKKYNCIFFDLDHTLWDYETNCAEALHELHHRYGLSQRGIPSVEKFIATFIRINNDLWDRYDRGLIHRDVIRLERFHRILMEFGVDDYALSLRFSDDYLSESPTRKNLIPGALDVLDYLIQSYPLFIITNGFDEIQSTKVVSSGIEKYFKQIITSEMAGHKKPARGIFDFAMQQHGFTSDQSIMIGDNLITDIAGARNAQIDQVFFNPGKVGHGEKVTYEIQRLVELKRIL